MTSSSPGTPPISGPHRAADILTVFIADPGPKRVTDLARLTGLSPATASRIANVLVNASMLARNTDKSFAPGPDLISLARAVLTHADAES